MAKQTGPGKLAPSADIIRQLPTKSRYPDNAQSVSVNVRPIDNGYVVCKSYTRGGEFRTSEIYTSEKPDIDIDAGARSPGGTSSMKDAVKYLGPRST
jgi:hypothetical protein